MKLITAIIIISVSLTCISCTAPAQHSPTLQDFPTRTLPTGGGDAAQAAHTI